MEKIKKYVNELFKDAPKTNKTEELKEELLLDLTEKYNDLIKEGKTKTEAYNEVISGIGDTTELINSLNKPQIITNENRKKTALIVTISVFIYILSIIAVIVLAETGAPDYAIVSSFLTLIAVATCMLIYHFMSLPKNNEVEIKKEIKKEKDPVKEGIGAIIWISATIIYILVSFFTFAWHITWIIFLMAVVVQEIVKLCLELGGK